ncbi:MAG TPA: serine/threonine-protein kinase [Kofleriaceae bacterium]|nr:serine/threonine-protein kinase [Kofleriaceae bacterium]
MIEWLLLSVYGNPQSLIGTVLADTYEIERVVGEGAYGTVYAARHRRLHKPVAVKVLRSVDQDAFQRFRREAEITSSLGSRFIAQVYDFNTMPDGAPYLVMELLDGEDLGSRLKRKKRVDLHEALRICEQVSMALSVAHRHQIVHRDLKPQNIFLCKTEDEGEVVKVIDFGISKVLRPSGASTAVGQFIGTPLYMSPEQVRGQQDLIDERSDIYALAIVLYEAIGGRAAYEGEGIFALIEKINGPALPPPLADANPELPRALDDALRRAFAKARDDRPRSITTFYNEVANTIRGAVKQEAQTPAAAIMGTHALETMYATGMVATPLWRGRSGRDDELRFVAPEDGFAGGDNRTRALKLTAGKSEFFIGSVPAVPPSHPEPKEINNDLVLPHRKVSRNAVRVLVREGRVYMRREQRCTVPVRVGLSILEQNEERPLHHGQAVAIGVVAGVFHDGRYVPSQAPAQAVDEQTGLLGREGLAWEVALAARLNDGRRMVLGTPIGEAEGDQNAACRAALAVHALDPTWPVARFRQYVAVLVKPEADLSALADAAIKGAGVPLLLGHHAVGDSSDEAGARIDEAIGALTRIAASGSAGGLVDLGQHQLTIYDPDRFVREARALVETGGEVGLVALEEREQLKQLGDAVCAALELELLQVAGRAAGPQAIFCRPAPGAIGFASPDAAEPVARQIAAEWHSRGPVRGEVMEVERSAAIDVLHPDEIADIKAHAMNLASGAAMGAGIEGLPLPLAQAARNAANATTPLERAAALVEVVGSIWRFLAIALGSMAAAARRPPEEPKQTTGFAEPWRSRAVAAAAVLAGTPGRVGELVARLFDGAEPKRAFQVADAEAAKMAEALRASTGSSMASKTLPQLVGAVNDLLVALRPLRGWTLACVVRVDRVDVFGDCETVHYIDYTGTYQRGTPRQVTLIKDLKMGPFVYLTRFAEGIVVPLEPNMRRRTCPETGAEELYWAAAPILQPGSHRYESVIHRHTLDDDVTAKQIPRGTK